MSTAIEESKLELVVQKEDLAPESAQALLTSYRPFFDQAHELIAQAQGVQVTDATQVTEIKESRRLRLELVKIRTSADKLRKQMKDESLRKGRAIDGVFAVLRFAIEPMEEKLREQEEFAERAEAARKEKLRIDRMAELKSYEYVHMPGFDLSSMNEEDYEQFRENVIARYEGKIAREKKAEEERLAKEKAELEERERTLAELDRLNEQLKIEAEERARQEEERKRQVEEARQKLEKLQEKTRADREEADRKAAAEMTKIEEQAKAEREAREKAEAELAAVRKAEADRKAAEEEVIKKRNNGSDKEKLLAFKDAVAAVMPLLSKPHRTEALTKQVQIMFNWIDERVDEL